MARGRNIIVKGRDGKVAIATTTGQIKVVSGKRVRAKLADRLAARQAAGQELTKALAEAGYDVVAGTETDVFDPGEYPPKTRGKK